MASLRRRLKRARRRVGVFVLGRFGPPALRLMARTWKHEILGTERLERALSGNGVLVALWHGRMVVPVSFYGDRGWHVLVSASGDGDVSGSVLQRFGYTPVRGSTSARGATAVREMLQVLDRRGVVIITPDGPRGPRHTMSASLAWMARATGRPVIPIGVGVDRAWRLNSWDGFTIPKPGARIAMTWGEPIGVPRDIDEAGLRRKTDEIREALLTVERSSFAHVGVEPDF